MHTLIRHTYKEKKMQFQFFLAKINVIIFKHLHLIRVHTILPYTLS
jgi:hypothetical protein